MQDRLQDLREVGDNLVAAYHLFARQECTFSPRPLHPPPGGRAIEPYKLEGGLRGSTENGHTHFNLQVLTETKNSPPNWNAPARFSDDESLLRRSGSCLTDFFCSYLLANPCNLSSGVQNPGAFCRLPGFRRFEVLMGRIGKEKQLKTKMDEKTKVDDEISSKFVSVLPFIAISMPVRLVNRLETEEISSGDQVIPV